MTLDRLKKAGLLALALTAAGLAGMATPAAFAQDVTVGSTRFTLGTSRPQTLGAARAQYNVVPSPTAGLYFLYPKTSPLDQNGRGGRPDSVGSLVFSNNRLERVTHDLGSFRSRAGQVAIQNMIRAFSDAPNEGNSPSVHSDTNLTDQGSTRRVYFQYPDRTIQVVVFQPMAPSELATVNISEQYALPDED